MSRSNALQVTPLTPAIGAVLTGVDLAGPVSDDTVADIRAALLTHQVVFFREQSVTPVQQRDFAARFGPLHIHPLYEPDDVAPEIMVIDNHPGNPTDNNHWHTDVTFIETPPLGCLLYAESLPASGGDTLWSSMTAAYRALSPSMQAFLSGLQAVHSFAFAFSGSHAADAAGQTRYQKGAAENPPVLHPVVRTHPETGERGLFVNSGFTQRIKGLRSAESRAILDMLYAHVAQPEFTVRWRWAEGDLAFWDNRVTQHRAVDDYLPARRLMRRATVLGDRPVFASVN